MGIQKINHKDLRWRKISLSSGGKVKEEEDNPIFGADTADDFDGCERIEPSSELCMVEGQLCSIPYELYDLPDLREILSIETWNSYLTEEERFRLSAYLPDMDQHTFSLTLKELFDGSNINFGNPIDNFFTGLKAGCYPPKVTCLREYLQFLQRKMYYHSLRSYHDRMVKMFVEMRMLWDQCENTLGVEERISLWRKKRNQSRVDLLDLNKSPQDDHVPGEELNVYTKGVAKDEKDISSTFSINGTNLVMPDGRAKWLLKMKASQDSSLQNHANPLSSDLFAQSQKTVPKGVLKRVPKVSSVRLEQSAFASRGAHANFLLRNQGLQDLKLSPFLASLQLDNANSLYEPQSPGKNIDSTGTYSTIDQTPCLLNQQGNITKNKKPLECYTRRRKMEMSTPIGDANSISFLGKHALFGRELRSNTGMEYKLKDPVGSRKYPFCGESLRPDLVNGTRDFLLKALESYPSGIRYNRKDQHRANYSGSGSVDIANQDKLISSSPEQLKGNGSMLPLTYKRRKSLPKLNSLDINKEVTAEADLKHAIARK